MSNVHETRFNQFVRPGRRLVAELFAVALGVLAALWTEVWRQQVNDRRDEDEATLEQLLRESARYGAVFGWVGDRLLLGIDGIDETLGQDE